MGSLLWSSDRPEFTERIAKLAGSTTYRVPVEGKGTKFDQLPDAHAIAAALAFARRGPQDVGPDVAYCWVLKSDAYRSKVISEVVMAMTRGRNTKASDEIALAVGAAWDVMVWEKPTPRPASVPESAWSAILVMAIKVLYNSAWDSLAEAERKYHRRSAA